MIGMEQAFWAGMGDKDMGSILAMAKMAGKKAGKEGSGMASAALLISCLLPCMPLSSLSLSLSLLSLLLLSILLFHPFFLPSPSIPLSLISSVISYPPPSFPTVWTCLIHVFPSYER